MQLTKISIDGFGVLSHFEIDRLSSGLNVLHGSNGSGKTTILEFLRGLFCNYDRARQRRLLPPLKGGHPGGGIEVAIGPARHEIIRHARPGHDDTLAIKSSHGDAEAALDIRERLVNLDHELIDTIFFVSGPESHSIDEMLQCALRDGIELRTERRQATWIAERIDAVELERKDLFGPQPSRQNIESLEQQQHSISLKIEETLKHHQSRDSDWHREVASVTLDVEHLSNELDWLQTELQLVQSDLTEVNDRLWSQSDHVVEEQQVVEHNVVPSHSSGWASEVAEIDRQIAHAQEVLRDLASSRLRLTLSSSKLTGTETPDQDVVFKRQRTAIYDIERQTQKLANVVTSINAARAQSQCMCHEIQYQIDTSLTLIQQQLALLCQELSRQQSASEQLVFHAQRDEIDRCEIELTRQIQSLRLRRDDLIHCHSRTSQEKIQFRTSPELEHCECDQHAQFLNNLSASTSAKSVEREVVTTNRVVRTSNALTEDPENQIALTQRKKELQQQSFETTNKLCKTRSKLQSLQQMPRQFAADTTIQKLRQEFAFVEQQLADSREQWQSLAILQTVLQRTQEKLNVETVSPVMEEASTLLNKMTRGRYTAFRFNCQLEELLVVSETNTELPLHALSRGTLEQAALSFRLALWSEYQRRGIEIPLILDEVLADSDESRLSAAIETLAEFCADHHQVILMTCQEHLVNLFEAAGTVIRSLPGSQRTQTLTNRLLKVPQTEVPEQQDETVEPARLDRIQPDEPYWLQTSSTVCHIPSLGEQMARRIGSIGVRTVADLIELDSENTEIPLDSLQISAATLRFWQAESRLLCCVPDLTGRDAQLLLKCDVFSPSELAQANVDDLLAKASRFLSDQREYHSLNWIGEQPNWPSRQHFARWISNGQRARSYQQARDWSTNHRRLDSAHSTPSSHLSQGRNLTREHQTLEQSNSIRSTSKDLSANTVLLHSLVETERELRFFLNMDSPLVDAPSIGPKTAERFEKIGVMTVSDFVNREADSMSTKLNSSRLTKNLIAEWQQQAVLVCRIPELRGHDAQVLVACGLRTVEEISATTAASLFDIIDPFVNSNKGRRLLRSAKTPDFEEVSNWITFSQQSRTLRAA